LKRFEVALTRKGIDPLVSKKREFRGLRRVRTAQALLQQLELETIDSEHEAASVSVSVCVACPTLVALLGKLSSR